MTRLKQFDAEQLARQLERLRADACEQEMVSIPLATLDMIVAVLRSLPRKQTKQSKLWTSDLEFHAMKGLYYGEIVNGLAREISQATNLHEPSVRRRIQELKASNRFKELMATAYEE